jgi:hypothetical protein
MPAIQFCDFRIFIVETGKLCNSDLPLRKEQARFAYHFGNFGTNATHILKVAKVNRKPDIQP